MKEIEKIFGKLNESQKQLLNYLIIHKKATVSEFTENIILSEKMVRGYLNQFITEFDIVKRESDKQRDKNAIFSLKK